MQINTMEKGQNDYDNPNARMTTEQDFLISTDCQVGNYDPARIKNRHNNFHARPLISMLKPKFFKYTLFGQTWKPIAVFMCLFYLVLLVYYQLPRKACCPDTDKPVYVPIDASDCPVKPPKINQYQEKMCQIKLTQDGFEEFVKKWKDYHNNLVKILGLLLGFYVSTMMGRWWKQITNLPRIEDLAMALNGLIQPGIKGAQAALEFKKRLLRHALLSYTLMMITISPPMRKMYGTGDKIVRKGLATWDDGAINRLRKDQGSNFGWMDKWWLPINWCCQLVQEESGSDLLHVPRDGKEILRRLIHFKETCFEVAEYTHNPLPASQAVYFVCWTFLILGAFAYQPCNGGESSSWWLLEDLPIYPTLLFGLIFAWLKMADICRSPFDSDHLHYDIDLVDELDMNIWSASAAMESISSNQIVTSRKRKL